MNFDIFTLNLIWPDLQINENKSSKTNLWFLFFFANIKKMYLWTQWLKKQFYGEKSEF